jgi:hypothetical protein
MSGTAFGWFSGEAVPTTWTISGKVLNVYGAPFEGVTINRSSTGENWGDTETDENGEYEFTGVTSGVYSLNPSKAELFFTPPIGYANVRVPGTSYGGQDVADVDFQANGADVEWPLIWNVEDETPASYPTNVIAATPAGIVATIPPGVKQAPVGPTHVYEHSTTPGAEYGYDSRIIFDLGNNAIDSQTGSFAVELYGYSVESPIGFMVCDDWEDPYNLFIGEWAINRQWRYVSVKNGEAPVTDGYSEPTLAYGNPSGEYCSHQYRINFDEDKYYNRIHGKTVPNIGTQDSGWQEETNMFPDLAGTYQYLVIHNQRSSGVVERAMVQVWMGDVGDTHPDAEKLTSNYPSGIFSG